MTEEKEIVPQTNGENDEENNGSESITDEANADLSNEKESENENDDVIDLDADIIRQIEYYFGDANLFRDHFLREQMKLDDGWVPLDVLLKFNRLLKLSSDVDVIINALKKSTSGLLEIGDKKIRRRLDKPLPEHSEELRKNVINRTIYVKGFPKDISLDELLRFYKKYDGVDNIFMRRYLDMRTKKRLFKGSIFVTFKTRELGQKYLDLKSFTYKDCELLVMWQEEYSVIKSDEMTARRDRREKQKQKKESKAKSVLSLPTGTVLYFEDGHIRMTREEINTGILEKDKDAEVAFIDFKIGLTHGWIRFTKPNAAVQFHKLLDEGKISFGNHPVVLRVLEGDEEKQYLEKTADEMTKRRKQMKNYKHKSKGPFKGRHMKRSIDGDHQDAPAAKVKCDS